MTGTDYFQSYDRYFWEWQDDAEVVAIVGGSTIAYKKQLADLMTGMAVNGLPPFGALLLTLIATNDTLDKGMGNIQNMIRTIKSMEDSFSQESINKAFQFLSILETLPVKYKRGNARVILITTLFAYSHNRVNAKTSTGLARYLLEKKNTTRYTLKKPLTENHVMKEFFVLSLLLQRFPDRNTIIEAMRALPDLPEEILPDPLAAPDTEKVYTDFVEELSDNALTFQLGTLIKPLWAGFKIPMMSAHPSEQPLGGVSDLANKGNFDKLLLSEFANDDLMFMSRIANNEALYLHREIPPVSDRLQRILLIDISLGMWGTPKILAYAIWIAIHKHPKSAGRTEAYAVGNHFQPLAGNTVHEVIESLQKVETSLHCADGMQQFLNEYKSPQPLEIFLVTTPDNLKLPAVSKVINNSKGLFRYLITTTAEGEIVFFQRRNNALKVHQTLHLPLPALWQRKPSTPASRALALKPTHFHTLLLIPTPFDISTVISLEDDIYCISKRMLIKRSNMNNERTSKGWEIMLFDLPANGFYELGKTESKEIVFLAFDPQKREIAVTNLTSMKCKRVSFPEWRQDAIREFVFYKDRFLKMISGRCYDIVVNDDEIYIKATPLDLPVYEICQRRQKERSALKKPYPYLSIFKNIMTVAINTNMQLMFNFHVLQKDQSGNVRLLHQPHTDQYLCTATPDRELGGFLFRDGSMIKIASFGHITLRSSSSELPTIYLTSILDHPIGMGTTLHFAGNTYFQYDILSHVRIKLSDAGPQKLKVVSTLKDFTNCGLLELKSIVEHTPAFILQTLPLAKAEELLHQLDSLGASAEIVYANQVRQEVIAPEQFYDQLIRKFIHQILK